MEISKFRRNVLFKYKPFWTTYLAMDSFYFHVQLLKPSSDQRLFLKFPYSTLNRQKRAIPYLEDCISRIDF